MENNNKELVINIINSIKFTVRVKIYIETKELMKELLGQNAMNDCEAFNIKSMSNKGISIKK